MNKIKYEFGLFILDPVKHSLLYDGREVDDVFPQDIDILLLLVENAGDLVTRQTLIDEIWDGSQTLEDNSVSTAVSKVRRLMKKMDRVDRIKGISKKGYKFLSEVRKIDDLDNPPPP